MKTKYAYQIRYGILIARSVVEYYDLGEGAWARRLYQRKMQNQTALTHRAYQGTLWRYRGD